MLDPVILHNAYFFLIPLAILEGPILAFLCGIGAGLGYLNPFVAWAILVACDFFPDLTYYGLGRWGTTMPRVRAFATRTRLIREHLPPLEALWREHTVLTLLSAKLAYGIAAPLIVSAGISKVSVWRFASSSLLISTVFLGGLAGLGYGISRTFGYVSGIFGNAPLYLGLVGVFFVCIFIAVAYWARKRFPLRQAQRESNLIET